MKSEMLSYYNYDPELDMQQRRMAANRHRGDEVWRLHCMGNAPSDIASELGRDPDEVRAHICELWALDKAKAFS